MDENGRITHTVTVKEDITPRKRWEQYLRESLEKERRRNEEHRAFIAMANHEFRTPLSIIDGAAQQILRHYEKLGEERIREKLGDIRSAVARMTEQMESTLALMRSEDGMEAELEPCDLAALITSLVRRQAMLSGTHRISTNLDGLPGTILADHALLDHVFTNLLSNAVKYGRKDPRIEIKGWTEAGMAVVSVTDHGMGIPEDELPQLFQRFFRASTARNIPGTGVGLSLVKRFVELHNGAISVESVQDEGTTFFVRLPVGREAVGRMNGTGAAENGAVGGNEGAR